MDQNWHEMIKIQQQALTEDLKAQVYEGFRRHAIEKTGYDGKNEAVAFVAMTNKVLAGLIVAEIFWGALHIKYVYVQEGFRKKGLGTLLMQKALTFGLENNCSFAFVETMSFQALGFYQKMGFILEFTRSGYSQGTSFHYLKKNLINN